MEFLKLTTQNLPGSMLFIKSCNQIFMTFLLSENKNRVSDICYINTDYMQMLLYANDYIMQMIKGL